MPFLRQSYKQKPGQWGPRSYVQGNLFERATKIGIDPGDIVVALPIWERSGSTIHNYSITDDFILDSGTLNWTTTGFYFDKDTYFSASDPKFYTFTELSILSRFEIIDSSSYSLFSKGLGTGSFEFGVPGYYDTVFGEIHLVNSWAKVTTDNRSDRIGLVDGLLTYIGGDTVKTYINKKLMQSKDATAITSTGNSTTKLSYYLGKGKAGFFGGHVEHLFVLKRELTYSNRYYLSDNPYFLWQRVPPVFYSLPAGSTLLPTNLNQSHGLGAVVLTQKNTLSAANLAQSQSLSAPSLVQKNTIVTANLNQAMTVGSPALTQASNIIVQGLNQAHSLDVFGLTQKNTISIDGLSQANTVGNVTLILADVLQVANLIHSQGINSLDIVQAHDLAVNNLTQPNNLGSVELSLALLLEVAGLAHANSLDALTVSIVNVLAVDSLGHSHDLGSMSLTQAHELLINDLQHDQSLVAVSFATIVGKVTVTFGMKAPGMNFEMKTPNINFEME